MTYLPIRSRRRSPAFSSAFPASFLQRVRNPASFSVTDVSFGSVDVTSNTTAEAAATVSITCTGLGMALRVCVDLGAGWGGSSATHRLMPSGSNSLIYGLYSDAGRTAAWGSDFWGSGGAGPVTVIFPLVLGSSTQNVTLYGRVSSGQQTVPAGSYLSSFGSTDAEIRYGLLSVLFCNLLTATATTTFNVSATVPTKCRIAANNINFGSVGVPTTNIDASSTLSVTCTNAAPYSLGLSAGNAVGATTSSRGMTGPGGAINHYSLYQDSARTQNWGNSIGVDTVAGTGTGLTQSVSVYGRVAAQNDPGGGNLHGHDCRHRHLLGAEGPSVLDAMLTLAIAASRKARRGHLRHHLAARGLEIAAVRRDILSHKRGDMGEVCVKNDVSVGAKPSDDAVNVDRVPDEHGRKGG
jgi:spore coat protein U-like protein